MRTFVIEDAEQDRVVGYHALTAAQVEHEQATERVRQGMPRYPIPVILLARLAVDESVQGRGLGARLLADAMRRAVGAAERVGIRALLVHAIDEQARAFYERHGLTASPSDPQHLMILSRTYAQRSSGRSTAALSPAMDGETHAVLSRLKVTAGADATRLTSHGRRQELFATCVRSSSRL